MASVKLIVATDSAQAIAFYNAHAHLVVAVYELMRTVLLLQAKSGGFNFFKKADSKV